MLDPDSVPFPRVLVEKIDGNRPEPVIHRSSGAEREVLRVRRAGASFELAPGFAATLQSYMTVAQLSFAHRTALEYMILAVKGHPRANVGPWLMPEESFVTLSEKDK